MAAVVVVMALVADPLKELNQRPQTKNVSFDMLINVEVTVVVEVMGVMMTGRES